eukprot:TRINITY_DN72004_c0_g1_i1.p1 TRINITY_DN72004_c0_g1~~TRINITY_DN72004_c0_g1_i1.p1  ORF type:complete len:525 (-),score=102.93 TRINITY_DN72004_c0_g1_i1:194-1741(-)
MALQLTSVNFESLRSAGRAATVSRHESSFGGGDAEWAVERAIWIGGERGNKSNWINRATLVSRDESESIVDAVSKLNAEIIDAPSDGLCIVFSVSKKSYFLLWRNDAEEWARRKFPFAFRHEVDESEDDDRERLLSDADEESMQPGAGDDPVLGAQASSEYLAQGSERSAKRRLEDPDGNIYRGWAVSFPGHRIQFGSKQLLTTIVVILIQIFGPLFMVSWACREFHKQEAIYIWECTLDNSTCVPFGTESGYCSAGAADDADPHCHLCWRDFELKFLGFLLMVLLYMNGDEVLRRQDTQTDKLRRLYGQKLSRKWMCIDAFCNSWCIAVCGIAVFPLMITTDGIKDLVLDAFGLLFLHNLDEYSGDIEYGVEVNDFDDLVDQQECLLDVDPETFLETFGEGAVNESLTPAQNMLVKHFAYGDVFFSLARFINMTMAFYFVPKYLTCKWQRITTPHSDGWLQVGVNRCIMAVLLFALFCYRAREYFTGKLKTPKRDLFSFFYLVILRRHKDPRFD